MGGIYVNR